MVTLSHGQIIRLFYFEVHLSTRLRCIFYSEFMDTGDTELFQPLSDDSISNSNNQSDIENMQKINWNRLIQVVSSAAFTAIATILTCYNISKSGGHFPDNSTFPPISFMGYKAPERYVYIVGFNLVSVAFVYVASSYFTYLISYLDMNNGGIKFRATMAYRSAMIAFLGLSVHAIIPLQDNVLQVMKGRAELNWESAVHQFSAGIFFLGSMVHGGTAAGLCKIHENMSKPGFYIFLLL